MANDTSLILVSFVSSDPSSEAVDQPIKVVVEIPEKVIDSELDGKPGVSGVFRPLIATYLAGDAALMAAASKRLVRATGALARLSYAWLPVKTWASPPRDSDCSNATGNGISAWIVQPGDPQYPTP